MEGSTGTVLFQHGGQGSDDSDVWDDTALIDAYDRAVGLAKEEAARRMGMEVSCEQQPKAKRQEKPASKSVKFKWKAGAPCQAPFSQDGLYYEGTLKEIYGDGRTGLVRFVGYNNEEDVSVSTLRESQGRKARKAQKAEAKQRTEDESEPYHEEKSHKSHSGDKKVKQSKHGPPAWLPPVPPISLHQQAFMPPPPSHPFSHKFQAPHSVHRPYAPPLPSLLPPPLPALPDEGMMPDTKALNAMLLSWYMSGYHTGYYQGLRQRKKQLTTSDHHYQQDFEREMATSSTQDSS